MDKQVAANILVVDDDAGILELIKEILDSSYNVFTASGAYEALRIIHDHPIHLVTIDFMMPGMTGLDLLKEIRKFDECLPFIIITCCPAADIMRNEALRDAAGYLLKPFPPQELRTLVDKAIKSKGSSKIKTFFR